jgi:hypothetical protein
MVKTFRILMANQPKLMRELLVEMLAEESWIEIVGKWRKWRTSASWGRRPPQPFWSSQQMSRANGPPICDELLREYPALRIIAVAPKQNYTVCYWASFDIHATDIEPSGQGFWTAVKRVAETVSRRSEEN